MHRFTIRAVCFAGLFALVFGIAADAQGEIPETAKIVREEALRDWDSPEGHPLPLLGHWHRLTCPPSWQIEMIRQGHPFLPWISYHRRMSAERVEESYGDALKTLREWNLPFVLLTGGQWEADFYQHPEYKNVSPDQSGATLGLDGKFSNSVSPVSPVEPWRKLGAKWSDNPASRKFQELYPDPPLVFFLTNNEAHDLNWRGLEKSKRYMDQYGPDRSDEFKKQLVWNGWRERYGALVQGMKDALSKNAWRENVMIIAYNGFHQDWWDGAVPETYDNHWQPTKRAYYGYSCQAEAMNMHYNKPRVLEDDPDRWIELIFWDGDGGKAIRYEEAGIAYTPQLYGGWTQYNIWAFRPRVAREWRGSAYKRPGWWEYFATIIRAVDLVHHDPVLKKFWRHGELVINPGVHNPTYTGVGGERREEDRWYHLSTNLDPKQPFQRNSKLPVYTLARVIGEAPNREWLLYGHAGIGEDRKNVEVAIPDYKTVTVDIAVEGSFYHVKESDGSVAAVGDPRQVMFASNKAPNAQDDAYALTAGETLTTSIMRFSGIPGVLRNDSDKEGDTIKAELVKAPANGEFEFHPDGTFTYKPNPGFDGVDTFTYRTRDLKQASELATVKLRVTKDLAQIVDNEDEDFEQTAPWATTQSVGGFNGDIMFFPAGRLGGSAATWTFSNLPAGEYDVYMTWAPFSYQRPKRVPVEIFDGQTPLTKTTVNQNRGPKGDKVEERPWEHLGKVMADSGTLKVVLSTAARGRWVVADAVRIIPAAGGTPLTIDDGDDGFSTREKWLLTDEGFNGSARYLRGTDDKDREATATWTFKDVEPGVYELFTTWPAGAKRTAVRYRVFDGETDKGPVRIGQWGQPSDLLARGTHWKSLGNFAIQSDTIKVVLSNRARKANVMADAVALLPKGKKPGLLLDDKAESFSSNEHFETIKHGFNAGAKRFHPGQTDPNGNPPTWKISDLPAGRYRIWTTWFEYHTHNAAVTYKVMADGETLVEKTLDQSDEPKGTSFEGTKWQEIGVIESDGGELTVQLNAPKEPVRKVIADAIWLQPIE